jgi:hypothetical protein
MREYKTTQKQSAFRAVSVETPQQRIIADVVAAGLLEGNVTIPHYDEVDGKIEIRGQRGYLSGAYLFTPGRRSLLGNGLIPDPMGWPEDRFEKVFTIIQRHNPQLAKRLQEHRPC